MSSGPPLLFLFTRERDCRREIHGSCRPIIVQTEILDGSGLSGYMSYKAAFAGIPTVRVNPEYPSQECPFCGHTTKANRQKRRFKCRACGRQDHADPTASINIATKGIERETELTVLLSTVFHK